VELIGGDLVATRGRFSAAASMRRLRFARKLHRGGERARTLGVSDGLFAVLDTTPPAADV